MTRFPGGVFPLGTHVYREPHQDQDELMADLAILARLGFNMIKIQESWSVDEPREGDVDLSRVERVIARAAELGLGVYVGLTMEQAPAWMWRRFPDCGLVRPDGTAFNDPTQYCLPADGKPGPCWDHPGARTAGERFVRRLARTLGRFGNIWCWNTWQEIGFWPNDCGPLGFCYCLHSIARFREWVRERYGSLEALNRAWRTGFGEWDEIEPPRRDAAVPATIDWRYFMENVYVVRALEWKTRALREGDPRGRPVLSHVGAPRVGAGAEWRWARAADFWGNSNYPAWGGPHGWDNESPRRGERGVSGLHQMWNGVMLNAEYCRSANGRGRTYWGAEFQGGPVSTHLHRGRDPEPEDIRRWMLSGLAAGMNGISFWNHRCEIFWSESNGFGLLDPRGESTPRIEEAARIGRAVNESPELFSLGEPPRAEVAVVVSDDLHNFCAATGNDAASRLQYSVRGNYWRMWRMGVALDFVEADEVASGALEGYRAALLPFPISLDGEWFRHLARFVEGGGTLVSEACPGRFDRYGFCPRAQMVDGGEELFGACHETVRIVREPGGAHRFTPEERAWGEFAPATVLEGRGALEGARLRASFWLQTLRATSGEPVLMAGDEVAGVVNSVGEGRAVLLGTFAGHSARAHVTDEGRGVVEEIVRLAGVTPDRVGALLRRRRVHGDREAWFLLNPTGAEVAERVELGVYELERDLLGDTVVSSEADAVTVAVPATNAGCIVVRRKRVR